MELLLDADALIKLNRAAILARLVTTYRCVVPQAVYDEVVIDGRAHEYKDADDIADALAFGAEIANAEPARRNDPSLGAGELAIMNLWPAIEDCTVVSDDRQFLSRLTREGIPFLSPADLLVMLAREGVLSGEEATLALERMRSAISAKAYWEARQELGSRRGETS